MLKDMFRIHLGTLERRFLCKVESRVRINDKNIIKYTLKSDD